MQQIALAYSLLFLFACGSGERAPTEGNAAPSAPLTLSYLLSQLALPQNARMVEWNAERMHPLPAGITWLNEQAIADKEGHSLVGKVRFQLLGNGEMQEEPMEWEIRLAGDARGYNRILLAHFNTQEATLNDAAMFLGTGDFVLREVQRCDDDLMFGFTKHELTFSGKLPGWLRVEWSSGSMGMGRSIVYSFDPAVGKSQEAC